MRDPDDLPRRLKIRTTAQSAVLWIANKYGVQIERLRKAPHIGRAMAAYSRYYRIDLRDAASAVVYYATLSLLPVLVLGYLALAWLAQKRPKLLKNANQNLANTLGIPAGDVSSLFDAEAHALLTATTSVIGVLYGAWAWMNTVAPRAAHAQAVLPRALRAIWSTDDAPEPWKRFTRDSFTSSPQRCSP
jgi:uncharacterized BrkB/YihY/UPF0761 family membrane protein